MDRAWLISELKNYKTKYAEEAGFISRFLDLLFFDNCFERSLLQGHITASAWVLTPNYDRVALLHHKKLNRWLQPGGHADGDENVLRVAKKELKEETGISDVSLIGTSFFDLDIHVIPERKGVPEHEHFDLRFALVANEPTQLVKNDESNQVAWVAIDQLGELIGNEPSIFRMNEKILLL